jgi:hypothetical protein
METITVSQLKKTPQAGKCLRGNDLTFMGLGKVELATSGLSGVRSLLILAWLIWRFTPASSIAYARRILPHPIGATWYCSSFPSGISNVQTRITRFGKVTRYDRPVIPPRSD